MNPEFEGAKTVDMENWSEEDKALYREIEGSATRAYLRAIERVPGVKVKKEDVPKRAKELAMSRMQEIFAERSSQ